MKKPTQSFDSELKKFYGREIIRKHKQYLDETISSREQHKQEQEDAILRVIERYYYSEGGISHHKLADLFHLHIKSLRVYTQNLLKKGLIKREGNGHHGKYVPTRKLPYSDLLLRASLFGDEFKHLLNAAGPPRFCVLYEYNGYCGPTRIFHKPPNNINPVDATDVDFTTYTKYYEPKFMEDDRLERILFESSNRIGALIIYAIIQAMNLANDEMQSLSKREQNQFISDWVHTCISQVVPYLVFYFKDSAYRSMYPRMENPEKKIQTSELSKSFEKLYPYVSHELRKSLDKLPKSLEGYKKQIETLGKESEMQINCKHQFDKPYEARHGYYDRKCLKCHYIKEGKMPRSKKQKG